MPAPLGFAIVGRGMIARFHVQAIQAIPDARIAALVSRTPGSAAQLVSDTGLSPVPVHTSVAEAVADPAVDVVVITTPSGAHLEPAAVAAAAGKHVVVEKPLGITRSGATPSSRRATATGSSCVPSSPAGSRTRAWC